ncbi:MAG: NADAR family protein [Candidatus Pacearchaeota archaeon]
MINEFRGKYYFLSNFYSAPVMYEGLLYENNEAAFQSAKLKDRAKRECFCNIDSSTAKRKGRQVALRQDWEDIKDEVMYQVVKDKFSRNVILKNRLLDTKNEELVEGNTWNDTYWGVCRGRGKNMLGKILMRVREELR